MIVNTNNTEAKKPFRWATFRVSQNAPVEIVSGRLGPFEKIKSFMKSATSLEIIDDTTHG